MIRVKLITLGKLKEKYLREAAEEYIKRLSRYCTLEIVELQPKALPEDPSAEQIAAALNAEAELIEKQLPKGGTVVALCIEGKQQPSEKMAELIERSALSGGSISFIIGSSFGMAERIKNSADVRLSMSQMTFPHQLARVMLLEQIYRGFKISEGSTYHK